MLARQDWVLFEIGQARRAGKPVLPVLVGGGSMPPSLPAEARFLSTINAFAPRDESWENDVERLIARLPAVARAPVQPAPPLPVPPASRRLVIAGALVAAAVVIGIAIAISLHPDSARETRHDQSATAPRSTVDPAATQPPAATTTAPVPITSSVAVTAARDNKPPTAGSSAVSTRGGTTMRTRISVCTSAMVHR